MAAEGGEVAALTRQFESYHNENQKVAVGLTGLRGDVDTMAKEIEALSMKVAGGVIGDGSQRGAEQNAALSRVLGQFARKGRNGDFAAFLRAERNLLEGASAGAIKAASRIGRRTDGACFVEPLLLAASGPHRRAGEHARAF